jgi:hypothetical protein
MTRKFFTWSVLILALLGLTAPGSSWAAIWRPLNGVQAQESAPQIQLLRSDLNSVQFRVDISGFSYETVSTRGGEFTAINLDRTGFTTQTGSPQLPVIRQMIEIPFGAQVSLETGSTTMRQGTLAEFGFTQRIIPVQPPVVKMPGARENTAFVLDEAAYAKPGYMIGQMARIVEEGQIRDHRFVQVEIYPFDYSPTDGRLQIISSVEITLQFSGADLGLTQQIKKTYADPYFNALARRVFLNPGYLEVDLVSVPLSLLIVTNNHYANQVAMNDFITWKKNKG